VSFFYPSPREAVGRVDLSEAKVGVGGVFIYAVLAELPPTRLALARKCAAELGTLPTTRCARGGRDGRGAMPPDCRRQVR